MKNEFFSTIPCIDINEFINIFNFGKYILLLINVIFELEINVKLLHFVQLIILFENKLLLLSS